MGANASPDASNDLMADGLPASQWLWQSWWLDSSMGDEGTPMRLPVVFAFVVTLICLGTMPSYAEKRVALVIGNGTYSKVPQLVNPPNDAGAIATLFRNANFDVVQAKTNLDLASMRRALRDFAETMRDADVVVVFFAGHGIEVN